MDPVLGMTLCWLAFAGTHVGLASRPLRDPLVGRLGEIGFGVVFSLVASALYTLLVVWYATHRSLGPPGPALGGVPGVREALIVVVVLGVVLAVASFEVYPRSPYAVMAAHGMREPRGLERITRHAFFVGLALFALAHALLATRLIGTVLMLGFAALAIAGPMHQDRKLLRLRGASYAAYLAGTSFVPFGAIVAGRQRLELRELPFRALALGVLVAFGLRAVHVHLFDAYGAWVIGATVGGAAILAVQGIRAHRRRAARAATPRTMSATIARADTTGSDAAAIGRPTTR
jgi:uncharacterized membrane protein